MDRQCTTIQESLAEAAGDLRQLSPAEQAHVEVCPTCAEAAAAERGLAALLAEALPPEDPELQVRIVATLKAHQRRRRLLSLVPVAASLAVAILGAVMVGGIPGLSLLGFLPDWSSQAWLGLAGKLGDWQALLVTTSHAASRLLPASFTITAWVVGAVGALSIAVLVQRWRKRTAWSRRS